MPAFFMEGEVLLSAEDTGVMDTEGLMSLGVILDLTEAGEAPEEELFDELDELVADGGLALKALISNSLTTMLLSLDFLLLLLPCDPGGRTIFGRVRLFVEDGAELVFALFAAPELGAAF